MLFIDSNRILIGRESGKQIVYNDSLDSYYL